MSGSLAAAAEFWTDNAVHLPQMIATGWLGLQSWQELEAASGEASTTGPALPFLRFALLLLVVEPRRIGMGSA